MMYQSLNFLICIALLKSYFKKHCEVGISPALKMQILMPREGKSMPVAIGQVSDRSRTRDQIHLTPIPCS